MRIKKTGTRAAFLTLAFLFTANFSFAGEDVVLKAMEDELSRTMEKLRLDDMKKPYFAYYYVVDSTSRYISASFGDVLDENFNADRYGKVEIRVGDEKFDSSRYIGANFYGHRPFSGNLPVETDYDAIRKSLWLLGDEAYKDALEKYSQKDSYRRKKNIKEIYGDLSEEKATRHLEEIPEFEPCDPEKHREKIVELSALFRKFPRIQSSAVSFSRIFGVKRFANSEGTVYRRNISEVTISARLETQNAEGYEVSDSRTFVYEKPSDIDYVKIGKELEDWIADYSETARAEKLDFYVGPAIFEGDASREFFNQLFVKNVSFAPVPWAEKEEWLKYYYDMPKLVEKIGMRVFPPFISVYDDPLEKEYEGDFLFGHYMVDEEGVKPRRLELVERGKLTNIYLSRFPYKDFSESNGHGRMTSGSFPAASAGNVFIKSEKRVTGKKIRKDLIELGKELELDSVVVIKDIKSYKNADEYIGHPKLAFRLDLKTGEETPLTAVEFEGLTLRALRDIIETGLNYRVYNFSQESPFAYSRGNYPTSIVAPDAVLVREVELKKTDAKPAKLPYLKHPYFGK